MVLLTTKATYHIGNAVGCGLNSRSLANYLNPQPYYFFMAGNLITDRVKQLVRMRGPLIPSQISKEIGTNILMASAILSELASKSDVRISSVKVGGSPLYYVSGQEPKLQNYLGGLHQKEKEAFEQLKTSGVLKDSSLEPVIRVALRQIKDFAKPIEASMDGNVELFWKWYLLSNEEAEAAIKKIIGFKEEREEKPAHLQQQQLMPKIEPVVGTETFVSDRPTAQTIRQQTQQQLKPQQIDQSQQETVILQKPQPPPIPKLKKQKPTRMPTATATEFAKLINEFFAKGGIEVESQALPKKSELEYVVLLPSPVGKLRYYCVAKNKKTCSDSDISSALVQGQLKKLPVLLLTKGELSKKAQELLAKDVGAITVKKI